MRMKKTFIYTLIILGMLLIGCSAITGKIEHEYGDWTLIQNETCEEDGILERKCKICGKKENQSIPKLSHEFDDGKITVEPTCTEKGEKTFTCKKCDATKTEEIDECGHSYDDGKITVEPTCTEKGKKTFTCKNCDATKTEEIDECGHSYDDGLVIEVATCTTDGSKKFICVVCNESKKEVIPATGHSYDGIKCSKCGTSSVTLCTTGVEYIENDNLKLTVSSLTHSEINGYNKYTINYVLKNDPEGLNTYLQGLLSGNESNGTQSNISGAKSKIAPNLQSSVRTESLEDDDEDNEVKVCYRCGGEFPDSETHHDELGYLCDYCYSDLQEDFNNTPLTEGMLDIIRAIVPKKENFETFALRIKEILNSNKYGISASPYHPTFVDVYSNGGPLDRALAKLTDYGIKATRIDNKITDSLNADSDDEIILDEGRYDLTPVKCVSNSNNSYWSPYDKKEGEFAEYGTRFRYDTRKGCMDAINDPNKELGYDILGNRKYTGKKQRDKSEDDKMEEKLILSEDNFEDNDYSEPNEKIIIDFGSGKVAVTPKDISPELLDFVSSKRKRNNKIQDEVKYYMALYALSFDENGSLKPGADFGFDGSKILHLAGAPRSDVSGYAGSRLAGGVRLGFCEKLGNGVYKYGPHLVQFITGSYNVIDPKDGKSLNFNNEDLSVSSEMKEIRNKLNMNSDLWDVRPGEGATPKKSAIWRNRDNSDISIQSVDGGDKSNYEVLDWDNLFVENFNVFDRFNGEKDPNYNEAYGKKVRKAYREYVDLDEDVDIIPEHFSEDSFARMCSRNGFSTERALKYIFLKDN